MASRKPRKMSRAEKAVFARVVKHYGSREQLARSCKVKGQSVMRWVTTGIPPHHVKFISAETGIPKEAIRPDIFG